jgi:hypothetical protein
VLRQWQQSRDHQVSRSPVGPADDQPSANQLIEITRIDAALIGPDLLSSAGDSAVNGLIARGIPFVLITGYGDSLDY